MRLRIILASLVMLSSFSVLAQTYKWRSLSMGAAGFVSGIITSKQQPGLMYTRTDVGGAYKWDAVSAAWTQLLDWVADNQSGFYGVESLAIDPSAPNRLYMLTGINYFDGGKSAILRSEDYGQTFTTFDVTSLFKAHGNGMGRSNGERLQVDPNLGSVLYVGTRNNGLWKSVDYGSTWSRLSALDIASTPNGNGISVVLVDPASGSTGSASQTLYIGVSRYASVGVNFYKSTDAGATFTPLPEASPAYMPQNAILNSNGELVMNWANGAGPSGGTFGSSVEPMNNGGIYKYNPVTGVWTSITPAGVSKAWGGLTVDPVNPLRMMASTINNYQLQYGPATGGAYGDRIYLTVDGGLNWRDVVNPGFALDNAGVPWINGQAIHWAGGLAFDPFNTNKVYITSGNGIFSNNDIDVIGHPWKFDVKGLEETVPMAIVSLPGGPLFTTVGDYDGFRFTDLAAYGSRLTPTMGTTTGLAYAGNNPNFLVRVGSKIYYSTDQGLSWTQTATINGSQGKIAITANGGSMVYCPNGSSTIYYSADNGSSWSTVTNTAGGSFNISNAIPVADMVNPSKVYLYNNGSGNFSVSNTGGASFTVAVNVGSGGSKLFRTIPGMEGHIWIPLYGGGLKRSTNSGASFSTVSGVTACSAIGYGKAAPGATYLTLFIWGTIGGITGIFRSIDEGVSWVRVNDNANQFGGPGNAQAIMGDMNNYGVVYMSTVGRGVVMGTDPLIAPLPVSLASFAIRLLDANAKRLAILDWTTSSEANFDRFDIERSWDGKSWEVIRTVDALGSANAVTTYHSPDDLTAASGAVYYRLRMIDKDGRAVLSNTVRLSLNKLDGQLRMELLQNPVARGVAPVLKLTSDSKRKLTVEVVAADGRRLAQQSHYLQRGVTNLTLEAGSLFPGIYTVMIRDQDGTGVVGSARLVVN